MAPQSPDGQIPPAFGELITFPTCNVRSVKTALEKQPGDEQDPTERPGWVALMNHSLAAESFIPRLVTVHVPLVVKKPLAKEP